MRIQCCIFMSQHVTFACYERQQPTFLWKCCPHLLHFRNLVDFTVSFYDFQFASKAIHCPTKHIDLFFFSFFFQCHCFEMFLFILCFHRRRSTISKITRTFIIIKKIQATCINGNNRYLCVNMLLSSSAFSPTCCFYFLAGKAIPCPQNMNIHLNFYATFLY